MDLRGLM